MRIFWSSNAPWVGSGYGQTTARFVPRIKALGHDVAIFAFFGLHGRVMEWEGIPVYPGGSDGWGNDVITAYTLAHLRDRSAGWLIVLQDVWTLKTKNLRNLHVAAWAPVDHTPAPGRVIDFFKDTGAVPISMSKHGHRMFEEAGLRPIYVPHGIDTNVFRPMPNREEIRASLGIPQDAFVFGMVANNSGVQPMRKAFPEVFQAFAKFREKHPASLLYLHTCNDRRYTGGNLVRLAEACGIEDSIMWVDQFGYTIGEIGTEVMPSVYSMMDVLLNPAYGEGFGMPIIEAQACGTPVVLADNTAMSELCGGGWLVPSYPEWDEHQASWWGKVRVEDLVAAMEKAYHVSDRVRREARDFVVNNYDADHVTMNFWKPALEELEGMLEPPEAKPVDVGALWTP